VALDTLSLVRFWCPFYRGKITVPLEQLVMFLIYILDIAAINIEKQQINEIIELVNI
jgi:hypothetical protein